MCTGKVSRYVAIFQKDGDEMIAKIPLLPHEFEEIRGMLGYDQSHPMYDCYPLTGEVLRGVGSLLGARLPLGDFDYLLEAEQETVSPGPR